MPGWAVAEYIMWPSALSVADLYAMQAYLAAKYRLSSLYAPAAVAPNGSINASTVGWVNQGCYADSGVRPVPTYSGVGAGSTLQSCGAWAINNGYNTVGLESNGQCYGCLNCRYWSVGSVPNTGANSGNGANIATACPAYPACEMQGGCGGSWSLQAFTLQTSPPAAPAAVVPAALHAFAPGSGGASFVDSGSATPITVQLYGSAAAGPTGISFPASGSPYVRCAPPLLPAGLPTFPQGFSQPAGVSA